MHVQGYFYSVGFCRDSGFWVNSAEGSIGVFDSVAIIERGSVSFMVCGVDSSLPLIEPLEVVEARFSSGRPSISFEF